MMFCAPALVPALQVEEGANEPVLHMGTPKVGSKFNKSCSLETVIRPANPKRPELHNLLQERRTRLAGSCRGRACQDVISWSSYPPRAPRLSLYYLNGNNKGCFVDSSPQSTSHIKWFMLTWLALTTHVNADGLTWCRCRNRGGTPE